MTRRPTLVSAYGKGRGVASFDCVLVSVAFFVSVVKTTPPFLPFFFVCSSSGSVCVCITALTRRLSGLSSLSPDVLPFEESLPRLAWYLASFMYSSRQWFVEIR